MLSPREQVAFSDISTTYEDDLRESKRTASGYHGYMRAKYSQHKLTIDSLMGSPEDRAPQTMLVTKNGITELVPADWFTQTGKLRKSKRAAYDALFIPTLEEQREVVGSIAANPQR